MTCTRCGGTGWLNVDDRICDQLDTMTIDQILDWIKSNADTDMSICDCCGDGTDWYNDPGEHDGNHYGPNGPYAYNGGLPECY